MGNPLGRAEGTGTGTGTDAAATVEEVPVRRSLSAVAASLGFRRVLFVRVVVAATGTRAFVTGVVHRSLRTVPVPLGAAARLAAAGALVRFVYD
jgi:hypothetical protein